MTRAPEAGQGQERWGSRLGFVLALLIMRRRRISRRAGTGLLVFYAVYLGGLATLAALAHR